MPTGGDFFYNSTAGLGVGATPGPFLYEGSLRFYPIKASLKHLKKFIRAYIGALDLPAEISVKPFGDTVFLVTGDLTVRSRATNIGLNDTRNVFFHVPVRLRLGKPRVETIVFLELFPFVHSMEGVLTSRELRGTSANKAEIHTAMSSRFLSDDLGEETEKRFLENLFPEFIGFGDRYHGTNYLTLKTRVSDEIGLSLEQRLGRLIELRVDKLDSEGGDDVDRVKGLLRYYSISDYKKAKLFDPHELSSGNRQDRGTRFGLLQGMLWGHYPHQVLSVKQIGDASGVGRASYQSLLLIQSHFRRSYIRTLRRTCKVGVYDHDSHPIDAIFGFSSLPQTKPHWSHESGFAMDSAAPIVVEDVEVREACGQTLCYRHQQEDGWSKTRQLDRLHRSLREEKKVPRTTAKLIAEGSAGSLTKRSYRAEMAMNGPRPFESSKYRKSPSILLRGDLSQPDL